MDVHKLDRIFKPKRIALFGASENPRSVGCTVLRNLVGGGYRGVVYPVHPSLEAVQGIHAYPDAKSLPQVPDLGVICASASTVPDLVRDCGEAGILGLVIVSAGFREAGPEGLDLEDRVRKEAARFEGMRIIGPNCLGIIVPELGLNASFGPSMPKKGQVAFISQSGALCTSVLDWAREEDIGFSHFVSIGNMLDVDFGDLIDYFGENEESESIIIYMESLKDARKFLSAARGFARSKPIVAYKAGRFEESAQAAGSHTGALAGEDAVYEAAFQRAGIARVFEIGEIFDCAELLARHETPRGPRLGLVTNAGGPGVMATDALIEAGGELAQLSPETLEKLNESLPSSWSHGNPVDVLGDARPKRFAKAARLVLDDPGVDALLVVLTPQAMTNPTLTAKAVGELAAETRKPILAAWLGGGSMREGVALLNRAGISTHATPEQAVRAFMTLVSYSRNLETLHEIPRDIPVTFTLDRRRVRDNFHALLPDHGDTLSETNTKALLAAYGIPVSVPREAPTVEEAVAAARAIGYPVVLKISSPDITHKTDVGGVELDLRDDDDVRAAFARITQAASVGRPRARLTGVTVQEMIKRTDGFEIIMGTKQDPTFGSVILVGMGGVTAEVFGDRALGFPPLNERLARRMLESLRSWPLLQGYRGRPGVNLDRLIEILMRFSYLVADFPEIVELDVNPVLAGPEDVVALDARAIIDREVVAYPPKPYSHLALRPYPEEYVQAGTLRDGTRVTLRPIKPEDEPRWMDMLDACSRDTIYARFRGFFRWDTHQAAVRFCYIDYDREIAMVAEIEDEGRRRLIGVGRLAASPDLESADYAVLVADPWQNQGLGGLFTDVCTGIAREWGVKQILAETSTDNQRMQRVFERCDFQMTVDPMGDTVLAVRALEDEDPRDG